MPLEINTWGSRARWLGIALSFALSGLALAVTLNLWFSVSHNSSRISETERRNDVLQAQVDALADANAKQDQLLQQANQELMRTGGSPLAPPRLVAVSFAADGCAFVFTMSDGSSITSQLPPVLCKE